ncbi:MAG: lysophospholipase [Thermoleophilaceae bacterium]
MAARSEEGRFDGSGGASVFWRAWLPDDEPEAVVAIAHGAAEHSGRYSWVAGELAARGHAVYALDHRGHGRSAGQRAFVDRLESAVADLHALCDRARASRPRAPVFLLGHSMGGLIALTCADRHQGELAGLILSAPLAVIEAGPVARAAVRTLSRLTPRLPLHRIDATTVSRDPDVVRAYERDPLNHRGRLPARTVGELAAGVAALPERLPQLGLPILAMHGTADRLVAPAGSALVRERAGSEDCTLIAYDGLYHELLNEPERERVVADVADWIAARVPEPAASAF